jgi:hypothetical protein
MLSRIAKNGFIPAPFCFIGLHRMKQSPHLAGRRANPASGSKALRK